jgi:hypothetical protein
VKDSPIHGVQTSSEVHTASCPMSTGGSFPGGKVRQGREADHPAPQSDGQKNNEKPQQELLEASMRFEPQTS